MTMRGDKQLEQLREAYKHLEGSSDKGLTEEGLLNLIGKYSTCKASGGNCGQWALGVAKYVNDKYDAGMKLGAITNHTDAETVEELTDMEPDVYHVFLDWDGKYYDETGLIDSDYLSDMAMVQYGDSNPDLWDEIEIGEGSRRFISYNTAWDQEWDDFYRMGGV
jgi:hypothetical protein